MKAIILAAGKGVRFQPLSITKPKPLIKLAGHTLLEHNLDQINNIVKEAILVVGYKTEMIKKQIGNKYKNLKITYVYQEAQTGTGNAAQLASRFISDKLILLNGDDLYSKKDIISLTKVFPSISVKRENSPENFGVIQEKEGKVINLVEKPKNPESDLVNTGLYFLPRDIFRYSIQKSKRGEYEFTDYIKKFIQENILKISIAQEWIPLSYSWNLLDAAEFLLAGLKTSNKGIIEKNVSMHGKVVIGENSIIRSGTYIIGPAYIGRNCIIGPNCFIKGKTIIEDNCRIGQAVEVKNSIVGKNTNIAHLSYVGDSIIDENCNLGAGTIIANLRHDNAAVKTIIGKNLVDTKRRKFGTVFGEGVKTGIGTLIYPGRKIWPKQYTLPGEVLKRDKK